MISIEEKRKLYLGDYERKKDIIDAKISDGIQKYRKGDCKIRFVNSDGSPVVGANLKITQSTHDFKFGANIFMLDEFDDEKKNLEYRWFFKEYFNLATVPFYWDTLEPEEGKPRYEKNSKKIYRRPAPDLCVEYCEENGISPKLHCLVYDKFSPEWLRKLSIDEIKKKYEERFKQISERYSGKMYEFEVINEQLEYLWNTPTSTKLTTQKDFIEWSFNLAKKYFPNEILVLNEGNRIGQLSKNTYYEPYYLLIENALLKKLPISKIGVQNHMFTGVRAKTDEEYESAIRRVAKELCDPECIWKSLDLLAEFGLPLELTEVTIPTLGDTPEDEELQADMLRLWYSVWFSHPAVETIVYWNTVDGYCYSDENWNENNCRGGLWHHDLTPKKSADTLKKLFTEEWNTKFTSTTNSDGFIDFRGFYGDYSVEIDGKQFNFSIHKSQDNTYDICLPFL